MESTTFSVHNPTSQDSRFILKTLHYNANARQLHNPSVLNSSLTHDPFHDQIHCVPDLMSKVAKQHGLYTADDRSIIEHVKMTDTLYILEKQFKKFNGDQTKLFLWHLKIIAQLFLYFK
jgi:hypothetical protein